MVTILLQQPIRVLAIVAVLACLLSAAGRIRKQGTLAVDEHASADLDEGRTNGCVVVDGDGTEPPCHSKSKQEDFRFEPSGNQRYLEPRNGALLAQPGSGEEGFAGCQAAPYKKGKLRIDGLPQETKLCVWTSEGRYSEIRLRRTVQPGAIYLPLNYTTWE